MGQCSGVEWIAFQAGFRVKMFLLLEMARESMGQNRGCSLTLPESFVKYDLNLFFWKIHPSLFPGELIPWRGKWSRWGIVAGGWYYPLRPLVRFTNVKGGSGFLPTPTVNTAKNAVSPSQWKRRSLDLMNYVSKYPTPCAGRLCGGAWDLQKILNLDIPNAEKSSMISGFGGILNPDWVEWLMGWPPGWTDANRPISFSGPPMNGGFLE